MQRVDKHQSPAQRQSGCNPTSISGMPARPACVSHVDKSVKKASFMVQVELQA
jgi:hypothetical protein